MNVNHPIKTALISVSDKRGVVSFATFLVLKFGVKILSTGGTAKILREAGIPVTEVSKHTGFPEIMGGRVKTLHPKIHGGLLCRRDKDDHLAEAQVNKIELIDLVVVNLYPFERTAARSDVSFEEVIEDIDIGGPSMLRSAAKNFESVTVIASPDHYDFARNEMVRLGGEMSIESRRFLAQKVFDHTATYDRNIADYLGTTILSM